jgi:hypothetical protein
MIKHTLLATTAATAFAALSLVVSPSFAGQGNPMGVQMAQAQNEGAAGATGGQMPGQMPKQMQGQMPGQMQGGAMPCPGVASGHGGGGGMHGGGGGMHGGGGGMHGGMMGMMGLGMGSWGGPKDLSADKVKDIVQGRLAWMGNRLLKAGKVTKVDDSTYLAEVVTVDGSLVQKFEVDRNTGSMRPVR